RPPRPRRAAVRPRQRQVGAVRARQHGGPAGTRAARHVPRRGGPADAHRASRRRVRGGGSTLRADADPEPHDDRRHTGARRGAGTTLADGTAVATPPGPPGSPVDGRGDGTTGGAPPHGRGVVTPGRPWRGAPATR